MADTLSSAYDVIGLLGRDLGTFYTLAAATLNLGKASKVT